MQPGMKNSKFGYGNFPNESLDQAKHFKHVFGARVGLKFEKMWMKMMKFEPQSELTGSYNIMYTPI